MDRVLGNATELNTAEQTSLIALYVLSTINAVISCVFSIIFLINKTPEMRMVVNISVVICLINLYILTDFKKLPLNLFLLIGNICIYVVVSTYFLGYNKNATILLPILILLIHMIFPRENKYLLTNTIVVLVTYGINFYIKYNVVSKYNDTNDYLELTNNFFALALVVLIIFLKNTSDKIVQSYTSRKIDDLVEEANIDFLTGLWNRRYLENKFETEDFTDAYIILVDIDYFKHINDHHGHNCGDYVLTEVAHLLKTSFRSVDYVCRWGGEEFLIYVKLANRLNVINKLEEIRQTIEETIFEYEDVAFKVTSSFGFCKIDKNLTIDENIHRADSALYYGKNNGRNCVNGFLEIKDKL